MGNQSSRTSNYHQYYESLKASYGGHVPELQLDGHQLDPYQVLGVSKTHSWDELKTAYRNAAKLVHPDRGGSEQLFLLVTECFRKLAYEHKMKLSNRQHHELKSEATGYYADRPVATRSAADIVGSTRDGDFNDKFNRMFQENKLDDEEEARGYAHMMAESSVVRDDIHIPRAMKKFQQSKFNDMFDKKVPVSKDVIVYKDPEPLNLARALQFTELGGKTDDYSSAMEKGERGLQYTDYLKAHTTTRLVDPKVASRKEYRNVEEYEAARSRAVGKPRTAEEERRLEQMKKREEDAEQERVRRLKERDLAIQRHHESLNRLAGR